MDKTLKYQKMCIEAFKDIGYIKPTASSNLMIPASNSIENQQPDDFMLSFDDEFDNIGLGSTVARPIGQLYQQDQLQGLWWSIDGALHPKDLFRRFSTIMEGNKDYYYQFSSPEQLWLAVIMWDSYSKIWDDKELKWTHT